MFTPELLEEIRLVLVKVRSTRRMAVTEMATRMKMPATEVDRVLTGRVAMTEETARSMAEALNIHELWWKDVVAVAERRLDHNLLHNTSIQRLADLGAVAERSGG